MLYAPHPRRCQCYTWMLEAPMEGDLRAETGGCWVPPQGQCSLFAIPCPSPRLLSLPAEMLDLSVSECVGNPNICPSSQNWTVYVGLGWTKNKGAAVNQEVYSTLCDAILRREPLSCVKPQERHWKQSGLRCLLLKMFVLWFRAIIYYPSFWVLEEICSVN